MLKEKEEKLIDILENSLLDGVFESSLYFPVAEGVLRIGTPPNVTTMQFLQKIFEINSMLDKYHPHEFYFTYTETVGNKYFFDNLEKIVAEYGSLEAYPNKKSYLKILHRTKHSKVLYTREIVYDVAGKVVDLCNYQEAMVNESFSVFLPVHIIEKHWKQNKHIKIKRETVLSSGKKIVIKAEDERDPNDIMSIFADYDFLFEDQIDYVIDMLPYIEGLMVAVLPIIVENVKIKELNDFIQDIETYYHVGIDMAAMQEAESKGDSGLYSGEILLSRHSPFIDMYFSNKKIFPQIALLLSGLSVNQVIQISERADGK